jgi:hypothetical protein
LAISGGHFWALFDFQSKIATVPIEIINAMIASSNTIFCIERLKKLLNRPSPDALAFPLLELPNADEPTFFELEIKSILLLLQNQRIDEFAI